MTLFTIAEPGERKIKEACPTLAVGIDLGTTNSLLAVVRASAPGAAGRAECLRLDPLADGTLSPLVPSVVHYRVGAAAQEAPLVGRAARALAAEFPHDTLVSVKRFMGKSAADAETRRLSPYKFVEGGAEAAGAGAVRFEVAGKQVSAVEVSAEILRALKVRAEAALGQPIHEAVITVPAYFDDAQRQATKDAGRLAGLDVLRLLNEPTAAALAYGLDKKSKGTFAVYDLGGGTFDISILKVVDGVFEVKSVGGDSALGGDDLDRALAGVLLQELGVDVSAGQGARTGAGANAGLVRRAIDAAKDAKERLTAVESTELALEGGGDGEREGGGDGELEGGGARARLTRTVTRAELEELLAPILDRTGPACRRALKDAGVRTPGETDARPLLDGVILVGGSTRVPAVRAYVKKLFNLEPLHDLNPDEVVALGAAVQADLLTAEAPQHDVLLLDVTPLSLGLETMGGLVEKLILRNTTIPASAAQEFTTYADGQTGMDIHVVQGERELVQDCRSLAKFTLRGIPSLPAGMARVQVTFSVDADGLLSVAAREQHTGVSQSIAVKPSHGLTDEEVERMLIASFDHAQSDLETRFLIDNRVEAARILKAADQQLTDNGDLLSPDERAGVERAMQHLRTVSAGADHRAIKDGIDRLDHQSKDFAQRIMDRGIERALRGHKADDFEGRIGEHAKKALGVT